MIPFLYFEISKSCPAVAELEEEVVDSEACIHPSLFTFAFVLRGLLKPVTACKNHYFLT